MSELEQLPLWLTFKSKANDKQRQMVRDLVKKASNLLDLIRDTFPTYTLHNHVHSENIVRLMGNLLGDDIENLTALEGAILILSAYYHDIGMVFDESERNNLKEEDAFVSFQNKYPEVLIKIHENAGSIPLYIAEWYCRWIHPERVSLFLDTINVIWDGVQFNRELGMVCRSHGDDAKFIQDDDKFPPNFVYAADTKFCAILLRLADILDFDNSRSPEEVYHYLGIGRREDKRRVFSDVEWQKHLCSKGFVFPPKRQGTYVLGFIASPDDPSVEHDVREFLHVIEQEFNKCVSLLRHCSDRWQHFRLPDRIDTGNITSQKYLYGEFRFTLDEDKILNLLMGENLYNDPYVFVRELIQNSIDTTRHRQFYESVKGNKNYQPKVVISHWFDKDNYRWLRIDDNGMGMTKYIIENYLFRVGRCYYESSDFEVEKLSYAAGSGRDFKPISRFGIGLLSCFIGGDRLEITTKPLRTDDSYRLSMHGLRGFYTLQSKKDRHKPFGMPSTYNDEDSYRKLPGTSVAVRLDPKREKGNLDLKNLLDQYIFCPPVVIEFEGKTIGGDPETLVKSPPLDHPIQLTLKSEEQEKIEKALDINFTAPIRIKVFPVDITKHSASPELKGQILAFVVSFPHYKEGKLRKKPSRSDHASRRDVYFFDSDIFRTSVPKMTVIYEASLGGDKKLERFKEISLGQVDSSLTPDAKKILAINNEWMTHNGMFVPKGFPQGYPGEIRLNEDIFKVAEIRHELPQAVGFMKGVLSFTDSMRPEVSVGRDKVRHIPWHVYSATALAFSRAVRCYDDEFKIENLKIFNRLGQEEGPPLGEILKDPYMKIDGEWASEPIIKTNRGMLTLKEIRANLRKGETFDDLSVPSPHHCYLSFDKVFHEYLVISLVQIGLKVRLRLQNRSGKYIVSEPDSPRIWDGQLLLPPLFFVPYDDSPFLKEGHCPLNQSHPFSKWLILNASLLYDKYPAMFRELKLVLSGPTAKEAIIEKVNSVINRLIYLDKHFASSKNVILREKDFGGGS